jgi:hypothetical protein
VKQYHQALGECSSNSLGRAMMIATVMEDGFVETIGKSWIMGRKS